MITHCDLINVKYHQIWVTCTRLDVRPSHTDHALLPCTSLLIIDRMEWKRVKWNKIKERKEKEIVNKSKCVNKCDSITDKGIHCCLSDWEMIMRDECLTQIEDGREVRKVM